MSPIGIGDAVVCVDAADLPSLWAPLICGGRYIVRDVDTIREEDGNYDKNIHKKARLLLRLWGVSNVIHPLWGKELGYAESRFEKIEPDGLNVEEKTKIEVAA